MLQPIMHILQSSRIVLASTSPRRKQILENIGLNVEIVPSNFEENLNKASFEHPYDYVQENALQKTLAVAVTLMQDAVHPLVVIGADTVVTLDEKIYEKPTDKDDAFQMLSRFSGRSHFVYTGVVLVAPKTGSTMGCKGIGGFDNSTFHIDRFYAKTEVEFEDISPEVINTYIETGEPMDKAGGYGIQGIGGTLVRAIHGDYFNVMGFPLNMFAKRFTQFLQNHEILCKS